jgi:hypothetical protein
LALKTPQSSTSRKQTFPSLPFPSLLFPSLPFVSLPFSSSPCLASMELTEEKLTQKGLTKKGSTKNGLTEKERNALQKHFEEITKHGIPFEPATQNVLKSRLPLPFIVSEGWLAARAKAFFTRILNESPVLFYVTACVISKKRCEAPDMWKVFGNIVEQFSIKEPAVLQDTKLTVILLDEVKNLHGLGHDKSWIRFENCLLYGHSDGEFFFLHCKMLVD